MQYKYTSMRDVIGMLIRNTRIQDSSYVTDAHEWIFEAMNLLATQQTLEGCYETITIEGHKGKLPCKLEWIDAVEYEGRRLPEQHPARPPAKHKVLYNNSNQFVSGVAQQEVLADRYNYVGEIQRISTLPAEGRHYYFTEMGYINTSFEIGEVTVYYRGVPVDTDGMPVIPDNQAYKNALYWYCRAAMIATGWKDPVFSYEQCKQYYDDNAANALGEIRLPSPEQMEHRVNTFVRFIPNAGYYDSFFHTDRPEGYYNV